MQRGSSRNSNSTNVSRGQHTGGSRTLEDWWVSATETAAWHLVPTQPPRHTATPHTLPTHPSTPKHTPTCVLKLVSDSSTPATNAPSVSLRPICLVSRLLAPTVNRHAATNASLLRLLATIYIHTYTAAHSTQHTAGGCELHGYKRGEGGGLSGGLGRHDIWSTPAIAIWGAVYTQC